MSLAKYLFLTGCLVCQIGISVASDCTTNESRVIGEYEFFNRQGDLLQVDFANGQTTAYQNIRAVGDSRHYYCIKAYYSDLDAFILHEAGYEWAEEHWVDRQSGSSVKIGRETIFSPDRSRIASMSNRGCGIGGDKFVGIWKVGKGRIEGEYFGDFSAVPEQCPSSIQWIGAQKLDLAIFRSELGKSGSTKTIHQILKLENGHWTEEEASGGPTNR